MVDVAPPVVPVAVAPPTIPGAGGDAEDAPVAPVSGPPADMPPPPPEDGDAGRDAEVDADATRARTSSISGAKSVAVLSNGASGGGGGGGSSSGGGEGDKLRRTQTWSDIRGGSQGGKGGGGGAAGTRTFKALAPSLQQEIAKFAFTQFAQDKFKKRKRGLFRRKVPVESMMKWSKGPLKTPLLPLAPTPKIKNPAKEASLNFKDIQMVMGDKKLGKQTKFELIQQIVSSLARSHLLLARRRMG